MTIDKLADGRICVHVDCRLEKKSCRRVYASEDERDRIVDARGMPVVQALARGWRIRSLLVDGTYEGMVALSAAMGLSRPHLTECMRLARFSPVIVEKLLHGDLPDASVKKYGNVTSPLWYEQHKALGID